MRHSQALVSIIEPPGYVIAIVIGRRDICHRVLDRVHRDNQIVPAGLPFGWCRRAPATAQSVEFLPLGQRRIFPCAQQLDLPLVTALIVTPQLADKSKGNAGLLLATDDGADGGEFFLGCHQCLPPVADFTTHSSAAVIAKTNSTMTVASGAFVASSA